MLKPLPTSIQTFCDLINGGYLYIDKTQYLYELIRDTKGVYFLARPWRFGKSLLISTLDEIFQGNKELFKGLWLYDSPYQWQPHPVIRIDFSRHAVKNAAKLRVFPGRNCRRSRHVLCSSAITTEDILSYSGSKYNPFKTSNTNL
jgi:hypothetical protein